MSDPRDRTVFGGARVQGPLNDDPFHRQRSHGVIGPPRGTIVVSEAPRSKRAAKPQAAPKVTAREISVVGSFDNPWKKEADEVEAMSHARWEPTSDDFRAVAGNSAVPQNPHIRSERNNKQFIGRLHMRSADETSRAWPRPSFVPNSYAPPLRITRHSTARVYRSFLNNHILPKWGDTQIQAVQPRPVELWLRELPLSPKSKTHVRSLMHGLVEFAMWAGLLEISRNPISLVQNNGATRRVRKARSLTVEQFYILLKELHEPFATMALLCVCLGLRISEALALRWADVDWLGSRLSIRRGIVEQVVDDVKTEGSAKTFNLASELLDRLKSWKQLTEFSGAEDWIFASPLKLGRLPYSYTGVWRELVRAASVAGIGHLGTHSFRHTYRSWLDAVGTPVAVQQKMMRHADIRTTFNVYGDVVTDEMTTASSKVAQLAFQTNGAQRERNEG